MSSFAVDSSGFEPLTVTSEWTAGDLEGRMLYLYEVKGSIYRDGVSLLPKAKLMAGDVWRPAPVSSKGMTTITTPSAKNNTVSKLNELEELLHDVLDSKIKVEWCDKPYNKSLMTADLVGADSESSKPLDKVEQYIDPVFIAEIESKINLQALLSSTSEKSAQAALDHNSECLNSVKTSTVTSYMPSRARRVGLVDGVYPFSSKEDCLSRLCPMSLEVKGTASTTSRRPVDQDCAALTQAISRVYVARCTDACINSYISMAVTGRAAWVVRFERNIESFNDARAAVPFERIIVHQIAHHYVWRVWSGYTAMSRARPGWHLTPDGAHLRSTLSCIADSALCLTKLISASGCRVYSVSLPREIEMWTPGGKRLKVVGALLQKPDLAVKVIAGDQEFDWESAVAEAVCNKYNSMHSGVAKHHIIGTHCLRSACNVRASDADAHAPGGCDSLSLENINLRTDDVLEEDSAAACADDNEEDEDLLRAVVRPKNSCLASLVAAKAFTGGLTEQSVCLQLKRRPFTPVSPCLWRGIWEPAEATGGSIVMRVGRRVEKLSLADIKLWQRGAFQTLRAVHAAGFFHCDIRPENVLLFGEEYQLIDHDRAVRQDRPTVLLQAGGQYDLRGASLLGCAVGERVRWDAALDYEMVAMAAVKITALTNSVV